MSRGRRISRVKFNPPSKVIADKYLLEWNNKSLFHHPEQFPKLTRTELFNQEGTISLDIGCGTGEFTNAMALQSAETSILGIEISRRAIYHAVNQAAKQRLNNIRYLRADFKLLKPLLVNESLQNVYLNFPDPNYGGAKKRKHRIFDQSFLNLMFLSMVPSGTIQIVTDQKPFLLDMLAIADSDPRFQKIHAERFLKDFSPPIKTRFQLAWEKFNRPVYRFLLKKVPKCI